MTCAALPCGAAITGLLPLLRRGGTLSSSVCAAKGSPCKPPAASRPQPPRLPGESPLPHGLRDLAAPPPPAPASPRLPAPQSCPRARGDRTQPCAAAAARGPRQRPNRREEQGRRRAPRAVCPRSAGHAGRGSPSPGPQQRWGDSAAGPRNSPCCSRAARTE